MGLVSEKSHTLRSPLVVTCVNPGAQAASSAQAACLRLVGKLSVLAENMEKTFQTLQEIKKTPELTMDRVQSTLTLGPHDR